MKNTINQLIQIRNDRNLSQTQIGREMLLGRKEISFFENQKRPLHISTIASYLYAAGKFKPITEDEQAKIIEAIKADAIEILNISANIPNAILNQSIIKQENGRASIIQPKRAFAMKSSINIGQNKSTSIPKLIQEGRINLIHQILSLTDDKDLKAIETIINSKNLLKTISLLLSIPKAKLLAIRKNLEWFIPLLQIPSEIDYVGPRSYTKKTNREGDGTEDSKSSCNSPLYPANTPAGIMETVP